MSEKQIRWSLTAFVIAFFAVLAVVVFGAGCCPKCPAAEVNGVLVNERVVVLPQDQAKWYISVVGTESNEHYQRLLSWFNTNKSLKKLKSQVHFKLVTSDTVIFNERYKPNIQGLPTVRVQKADGTVVYEAAGKYIPLTSESLYGAIANSTFLAQGLRPILPWRRQMENRPCPGPCPKPNPDPAPEPDDGGPPEVIDSGPSILLLVFLGFVSFVSGVGVGLVIQWKKTYSQT